MVSAPPHPLLCPVPSFGLFLKHFNLDLFVWVGVRACVSVCVCVFYCHPLLKKTSENSTSDRQKEENPDMLERHSVLEKGKQRTIFVFMQDGPFLGVLGQQCVPVCVSVCGAHDCAVISQEEPSKSRQRISPCLGIHSFLHTITMLYIKMHASPNWT